MWKRSFEAEETDRTTGAKRTPEVISQMAGQAYGRSEEVSGIMFSRYEQIRDKWDELTEEISQPNVIADVSRYQEAVKQRAALEPFVLAWQEWQDTEKRLREAEEMMADPEMAEMAAQEVETLKPLREELTRRMRLLLLPRDPMDERGVVMELRAGVGGEEAALFTADLLRMYVRYAERHGLRAEIVNESRTDLGGLNEGTLSITGEGAYGWMKFESGVHCVKRVPATESGGRVHTSTGTVAVLPELEDVELTIDPEDLRVDVYRSTGHGGQGVNTTDSAVRLTHLPTGIVVTCQDERSQLKNKYKAMKVLRSRLLERARERQGAAYAADRLAQIGTGDRSERIRTYYFNHGYVTDQRVHMTLNRIGDIMDGDLDEFMTALRQKEQDERLEREGIH